MTGSVKIGDKVRFINAKGGGIVRKFQSKNVILVEEDDGFETPVLISEVVVIQETDKYNFPIEEKKKEQEEEVLNTPQKAEEEYTWDETEETREGEELSLYLAYIPVDIKQLQTTEMDLYLVNEKKNQFIFFFFFQKREKKKNK